MQPKFAPSYLAGYPSPLIAQVQQLIAQQRLGEVLLKKYPLQHQVRSDRALYVYVQDLKDTYLRTAEPLNKVLFDNKLHIIRNALGIHSSVSRVQGSRLKTKREIRIASMFREMPPEFLRMIAVHELAHLKEGNHDKAFYKLCQYMEPDYHQLEFDLRAYLTYLDSGGQALWSFGAAAI